MGVRLVTFNKNGNSSIITGAHDALLNRDLKDQHPIYAITGLQDALDTLEDNIDNKYSNINKNINEKYQYLIQEIDDIKKDLLSVHETVKCINAIDKTIDTYSLQLDYNTNNKSLKGNVKIWSATEENNDTNENAIQVLVDGLYVPATKTKETKTVKWTEESNGETLQDIYTSGFRFSHNGTWDNIKSTSEAEAWYWDDNLKSFIQPKNTTTFTGFVTKNSYNYYKHSVQICSKGNDNDTNGVIIAYVIDENGRPHTLSALAHRQDGVSVSWKLVYDFKLPDEQVLFTKGNGAAGTTPAGYSTGNWDDIPNGITIYITKFDNIITATASDWNTTSLNPNTCISIDLDNYSWGYMFRNKVQYGYCNRSQAKSYFQNIYFLAENEARSSIMSANVKISQKNYNGLSEQNDGLYVEQFRISSDENNLLKKHTNGYYVGVDNFHSHNNIKVLDELGEQENELTYKGQKISSLYKEKEYTPQEIMTTVLNAWIKVDNEMAGAQA